MIPRRFFLEIFIALRYLRGHGRTVIFNLGTRLSFFFMALMVYIMVLVLCVFTGFQKEVHSSLWNSGYHIMVINPIHGSALSDYEDVVERTELDPTVQRLSRSIFPSISLNALLEFRNQFEGKALRAIPATDEELATGQLRDYPRIVYFRKELLENFNRGNYVLVGREMARYYGWDVGDRIRLFLPRGGRLARGIEVRQEEFIIAGFFRTGYYEFDLNLIFMSLSTAQRVLGIPGRATEVIIQLHSLSDLDQTEDAIRDVLPGYNYDLRTIRQDKGNFLAALQLEKTLMLIILSLLILAGVAGIWVTVHLLVRAKSRSIGMLRAMGLPTTSILVIFTAHSMLIGFLSTAVGGSIGIFVANRLEEIIRMMEEIVNSSCNWLLGSCQPVSLIPSNIYYFDHLPVQADLTVIFGVALATMILSGLAGYFPARRAAMLDPVETIRAE
ncbi:MAG: ABC transporter permease [Spirochaetales bacterium]|nr:ABC transporter permease [Leptospiraceae bacterium]MCP5483661.1 ABC transporter permease [Spirochaetales bacterium]